MGYVIAAVIGIIAGVVVTWIYKSRAAALAQKELTALKSSAVQGINKL